MPRKAIPKRSIKELIAALGAAQKLTNDDVEALNALRECIATLRDMPWTEDANRRAIPFDARHALAADITASLATILTRALPAAGPNAAREASATYKRRIADLRTSLEAFLRNADQARNPQGVAIDSTKRNRVLTPLQNAILAAYDALREAQAPSEAVDAKRYEMNDLQTTFTEQCDRWILDEGIEGPPSEGLSKMRVVKEWIEACKALTRAVMDARE
jgi:hypothetical protein